jgi:hypothetical protein
MGRRMGRTGGKVAAVVVAMAAVVAVVQIVVSEGWKEEETEGWEKGRGNEWVPCGEGWEEREGRGRRGGRIGSGRGRGSCCVVLIFKTEAVLYVLKASYVGMERDCLFGKGLFSLLQETWRRISARGYWWILPLLRTVTV